MKTSRLWENYSWIMQNAFESNEWLLIWVHKTVKTEIQKGRPNNADFLQNWFPPEIRSSLFNLLIFQHSEKNSPESCWMYWNLMNDKEFWSTKLLKLKYRRGHQIIQTFCIIASPQKLGPQPLICRKFKTLRILLLNHAKCIEI